MKKCIIYLSFLNIFSSLFPMQQAVTRTPTITRQATRLAFLPQAAARPTSLMCRPLASQQNRAPDKRFYSLQTHPKTSSFQKTWPHQPFLQPLEKKDRSHFFTIKRPLTTLASEMKTFDNDKSALFSSEALTPRNGFINLETLINLINKPTSVFAELLTTIQNVTPPDMLHRISAYSDLLDMSIRFVNNSFIPSKLIVALDAKGKEHPLEQAITIALPSLLYSDKDIYSYGMLEKLYKVKLPSAFSFIKKSFDSFISATDKPIINLFLLTFILQHKLTLMNIILTDIFKGGFNIPSKFKNLKLTYSDKTLIHFNYLLNTLNGELDITMKNLENLHKIIFDKYKEKLYAIQKYIMTDQSFNEHMLQEINQQFKDAQLNPARHYTTQELERLKKHITSMRDVISKYQTL